MKVLMLPHLSSWQGKKDESGIRRVVEAYFKHLPKFGIELVARNATNYDLTVAHAGMGGGNAEVIHNHGLYWTADYKAAAWEYKSNADVINSIRHAKQVTVPSPWVAETFQRDMHFSPHVVPHGIDWQDWQKKRKDGGYVLWNKNRTADVCSTDALGYLAGTFQQTRFLSTYAPKGAGSNVKATGLVPHAEMKQMVQEASVYLSTTKETFGIGVLEAMASGVPVLAVAHGGNLDLVQHGVNGYLARPDDLEDLAEGLNYCLQHRQILGANGREMAKDWTWQAACEKVAGIYRLAMQIEQATVAIIIPTFNYADRVGQAIRSALQQDYKNVTDVIIVDDGSTDNTAEVVSRFNDRRIRYIKQNNQGVANARNRGISETRAKYIVCLDADDAIESTFVSSLVGALEQDRSLGVVYSGLQTVLPDGQRYPSRWPGNCDFDAQVKGHNQVPTCAMFRRVLWERLGGYKQRYAPLGQGSEDAEFWLRAGANGWDIKQVTDKPLFLYSMAGRTTSDPNYEEVEWNIQPWCSDGGHPFASIATPQFHSHSVRQYDEPTVSVIIPVGPGHGKEVKHALDSLEWQSFRKWEAVIVNDSGAPIDLTAYPFARYVETEGKQGAGYARNRGAEIARGNFLVFLDADDWLDPKALQEMLIAWNSEQAVIYTDYIGKAIISEDLRAQLDDEGRILRYDHQTKEAVIAHKSAEYDPALAQRQPEPTHDPNTPFYHWCLVTCLIPKAWHNEIGGFDESMETWEDIEYHWRMARYGKCYIRIPRQLVIYNFHKGHRREASRSLQVSQKVVQYIRRKFEEIDIMPCSGCGKKQRPPVNTGFAPSVFVQGTSARQVALSRAQDDNFVLVRYTTPNRGKHPVVGGATQTSYGYRQAGERFLVDKHDIWVNGDPNQAKIGRFFEPVQQEAKISVQSPPVQRRKAQAPKPLTQEIRNSIVESAREPLPEPEPIVDDEPLDLQILPGITNQIAAQLQEKGITTKQGVLDLGIEGLQKLKGVGPVKAEVIIQILENPQE